MPPVQLPFPITALPGRRPGEGQGDLVNVYARKVGNLIRYQRVPGATRFTVPMYVSPTAVTFAPRGQIVVDNYLVSVWGDKVWRTLASGITEMLAGLAVPGTGPVTLARNMRSMPEVVMVADNTPFSIDLNLGLTGTVQAYPVSTEAGVPAGTILGQVNSVDYFSGYFIYSRPYSGEIVASDLQTMQWKTLSFARAESSPDGLLRVFSAQPMLLACGTDTIEIYQDVGSTPFPLQRVTVMPVGLLGTWAIAGGASKWDRPVCFVANDHTVRQLKGYDPIIVSNEDVVADIEAAATAGLAEELIAQAYTHGDNAIWSLTSPSWTWEYNLSTGAWHRRQSYQPDMTPPQAAPWRAYFATRFANRWISQDLFDGGLIEVTSEASQEPAITRPRTVRNNVGVEVVINVALEAPLVARCESGPTKDVPANVRMPTIFLDFTVGFNVAAAPDPVVLLSWSHDGGATWSNPLERHLGGKGEFRTLVRLNGTGRSSTQGMRLRWECADPVPLAFHSAVSPRTSASRPRQVDVRVTPGGADGG
jgi:hypothetical protein